MKGQFSLLSETPEMERVKANQRHISSVSYRDEVGCGTAVRDTPEMERVRRNQENISSVKYKQSAVKATSVGVTPEFERVRQNQENISSARHTHTRTHAHTSHLSDLNPAARLQDWSLRTWGVHTNHYPTGTP
uniref:Uncharacterized protein n=1 Tax=Labrus bergylta TaxID=56723 RepID=A0A3Q3FKA2_9LABR